MKLMKEENLIMENIINKYNNKLIINKKIN